VSRRAEKGDFVAQRGDASGISGRTVGRKKVSNHALICDFAADYQILHSKGRTVVTALLAAREADTDKLNKGAV
jgi:hypothetical protein